MGRVVADTKRAPDHHLHASSRLDIADEAVGLGTLREESGQVRALLSHQPRPRTRRLPTPQRLTPARPSAPEPLAHRTPRPPQRFGDPNRLPALLVRLQRAQTPPFPPVSWWCIGRAHAP